MSPLRASLVAVVMLNVGFVQITEAAAGRWLWPMYALALASPLLAPLAERRTYRGLWNVAVLAIFGMLVHHAAHSGIRHLLEDGLVLAAFCQVHLLNTLHARQRPDLLFLNSFLIALVTSFFCQDLVFCAVFALYAFVLLAGLQLALGETRTATLGVLLADGARKSVVALTLTLLVFVFLPRDFRRPGLVADGLLFPSAALQEVGFREDVLLGSTAGTVVSDRMVLRIKVPHGQRGALAPYLRGATCAHFDEQGWQASSSLQHQDRAGFQPAWIAKVPAPNEGRAGLIESWFRERPPAGARVTVEAFEPSGRVFLPLTTSRIALLPPEDSSQVAPLSDGTFLYTGDRTAHSSWPAFRYELDVHQDEPALGGPIAAASLRRQAFLELPEHAVPPHTFERARELAALPPGQPQHLYVEAIRARLSHDLRYLAPGTKGAARNLAEFMDGTAGGHCEYFATALAVLLRSLHIPCRVVTGYLAGETDEHGTLIVRSRDAHAWVEVLDPQGGWYTVDATPAAARGGAAAEGWLATVGGWFQQAWRALTGFDETSRVAVLAFLRDLPRMVWDWLNWSRAGLLAVTALLLAWLAVRRRHRGVPAATREYLKRARGRRAGETPREFLARARGLGWTPARLVRLEHATVRHERERYGTPLP